MCSRSKNNGKAINKNYIILITAFVLVVIGFVFFILHYAKNPKEVHATYPFQSCSYKGSLREAQGIIKNFTRCKNNFSTYKSQIRNNGYVILYNYVISSRRFNCEESVTYATHADYTFLDNLRPLSERWNGPISLAIHAPGADFNETVNSIIYLRNCVDLIKELVTFHLYFLEEHSPYEIPSPDSISSMTYNCSLDPPFQNALRKNMYVKKNNLTYPINVGRNVARTSSETYFVITSDIELYPNPNIISEFLKLIAGCKNDLISYKPAVFVLHIFEIERGTQIPSNKTELVNLLDTKKIIPFHQNICSVCHTIPKFKEWKNAKQSETMEIFNIGKRTGAYYHWEPIYIGTNDEPAYDERLTWEGMKDKVVQGYELCLLNYTFFVLDNAFLIHKPGIKVSNPEKNIWRQKFVDKNDKLIDNVILPEIKKRHKQAKECRL